MKIIRTQIYTSPCGELLVGSFEGKLCLCDWRKDNKHHEPILCRLQNALHALCDELPSETTERTISQLEEYFQGRRTEFDIPMLMIGTAFQRTVWQALLSVPYGETQSYRWQAERIGKPKAVRAVGMANSANPISIIVPCHRIIGGNRRLIGYGGGLETKRFLLDLESSYSSNLDLHR